MVGGLAPFAGLAVIAAFYDRIAAAARDWLMGFLNSRIPTNLGAPLASLLGFQEAVGGISLSESFAAANAAASLLVTQRQRAATGTWPTYSKGDEMLPPRRSPPHGGASLP